MTDSVEVQLKDLLPDTYSLSAINVYNWGPFNRRHCAEIDPSGTAIIGPTGSGKTTLVDAFMTLICPKPKYNLASTGGHESDRDLMSYVRGVSGAGNASGGTDHIARPAKTITAIEACFTNGSGSGEGSLVKISALLWIDSSSNSLSDLKRAWIFSDNTQYGIDDYLEVQKEGGMRALKQLAKDTPGLRITDSKNTYLAILRRFFDVGDNAFTLLNRAAGLKQINSIDDLFRDLVLDDCSAFGRAAEVAAEFDDLATIYAELETARQQQASLEPIAVEYEKLNQYLDKLDELNKLKEILPVWFATHAYQLWDAKERELTLHQASCEEKCQHIKRIVEQAEDNVDTLRDIYMESGGASIENIEKQIKDKEMQLARFSKKVDGYIQLASALGFDAQVNHETFSQNRLKAASRSDEYEVNIEEKREEVFSYGAQSRNHKDRLEELEGELRKASGSQSNIPSAYLEFQRELAAELDLDVSMLPFVAELIEVQAEESSWRGAIERAIGGHRTRLLVPVHAMRQALAWVNNRHNRLNVKLLRVENEYPHAHFFNDGFTRKLNFKNHPYREAVKNLLAGIDRHCVNNPDDLQHTPKGMTRQGLMSGRNGYFDKQDGSRLDQNWMTGFDNKDRVSMIALERQNALEAYQSSESQVKKSKAELAQLERERKLVDQFIEIDYEDIDSPGLQDSINSLKEQLETIKDPSSDASQAGEKWEQARDELQRLREQQRAYDADLVVAGKEVSDAQAKKALAFTEIGEGLNDEAFTLGNAHFKAPNLDNLVNYERAENRELEGLLAECAKYISSCRFNLGKQMTNARKLDTGALAEAGTELEDVSQYLAQLKILNDEALPAKQARFIDYLNQSSDQGVNQLLMSIENEVEKIKYRIEELNDTMRRVDYQNGRYIRLEPKRVVHESLNTLRKAQQHLRYAATVDDGGETHYKALQTVVDQLRDASERKKTKGAQALLDPRFRMQFSVAVVDRKTGETIESRTGSQGGSGGEKEIIASYILTASLSYALCPDGSPTPLFGTVVLDEAFSRSSQAVAGRIIAALREFGLHPLFITPNKEIKLLRSHTRSAVLIHNRGMNSTMTSLSWEELEQQAQKQRVRTIEGAA
ncbi:MAG: hypothetical protein CMI12_05040 [Oceanospirillum sp.]|nr:hypothetical protein [Oceanospirillum sp.]